MAEEFGLMLAGPSTLVGELDVVNPYSGETIARVDQCGEAHIEAALALAHQTFKRKSGWLSLQERAAILQRAADAVDSRHEELARGAASEGGKPLIDSRVEVTRAVEGLRMCAEHITNHTGEVVPLKNDNAQTRRIGFTQREPIGVVVAVSAFNHPLNLIVHQVGAAVAAGCPVIVKPARNTPLSCFRLVKILREAGLPEAWCQVAIPEATDLATALVTDPRVAFFSFIGSAKVGWMLRSKLADGTRCALEHGGVAPVIIEQSANLERALPAILKGGFYHAGQVCVSVQRVYVPNAILKNFSSRLAEAAQQLVVGDSLDDKTEVGPLIEAAEVERIHNWISEAVEQGAQLLCGGKTLTNNCYQPTVLVNPPATAKVSTEEIFGPLVCVYGYDDVEQAIEAANGLDVAFQAAVFTQDVDRAFSLYGKLDAATVMINDHTAFRQDNMPFAGLRHSGLGVGGIGHTISDMQIEKLMVLKISE
ncbi:MAG: aldehyde dehydrogenase family protein [Gammaproteobacteria bacterium]|nr:aldehyde dehydrogenase family protein [Gammaproteobacteria bacterium]NND39800.1 aldehyde dehydrogenase family protein [Pseudomonadales bacterium]NNM10831.1 aldehyde dehydrogenase family protein [Pseudomonadales bacterium]